MIDSLFLLLGFCEYIPSSCCWDRRREGSGRFWVRVAAGEIRNSLTKGSRFRFWTVGFSPSEPSISYNHPALQFGILPNHVRGWDNIGLDWAMHHDTWILRLTLLSTFKWGRRPPNCNGHDCQLIF